MRKTESYKYKLLWLSLFAITMALVESALVVYLRELYFPDNLHKIFPIRFFKQLDFCIELCREAATILMLLAVAAISEKRKPMRTFACFLFLFGFWDIFYYVWLKLFIGWPQGLLEWDILFLIPLAWLGPWICPVLISSLFISWGLYILLTEQKIRFFPQTLILFIIGVAMCLGSFMQPAITVFWAEGASGFTKYIPYSFWWWLFIPGFLLMIFALWWTVFLSKKNIRRKR